jgi:hypothetical protein
LVIYNPGPFGRLTLWLEGKNSQGKSTMNGQEGEIFFNKGFGRVDLKIGRFETVFLRLCPGGNWQIDLSMVYLSAITMGLPEA